MKSALFVCFVSVIKLRERDERYKEMSLLLQKPLSLDEERTLRVFCFNYETA